MTYLSLYGAPIVAINQYQYFPNGTYSVAFSNGIVSAITPKKMPAFSLYQWVPFDMSLPSGNFFSPNYQFDDRGGFGYFWNGSAWAYGSYVMTV